MMSPLALSGRTSRGIARPNCDTATDLDVCPYCGVFFSVSHQCEKLDAALIEQEKEREDGQSS